MGKNAPVAKFANTTKHSAMEGKTQTQMVEKRNECLHLSNLYKESKLEKEYFSSIYLEKWNKSITFAA